MLEYCFHQITPDEIDNHDGGHDDFELGGEGNHFQLLVDFRDEFRGAGECDARDEQEAPVHAAVFADALAEGPALVVDGEGGYLLDELEEVDGAVEEGGLEFAFEIDFRGARFGAVDVVGEVD